MREDEDMPRLSLHYDCCHAIRCSSYQALPLLCNPIDDLEDRDLHPALSWPASEYTTIVAYLAGAQLITSIPGDGQV